MSHPTRHLPLGVMETTWFALHTRHQHETKVARILNNKGFETFLPMYQATKRWSDRLKSLWLPLFPGYVFVAHIEDRRLEILNTHGVAAIVSTAGVPSTISEQEINVIRQLVKDARKVEPHSYLRVGDEVRLGSGPLAGTNGFLVRKKDCYRLVVCVEILGRAASVEIYASDLDASYIPRRESELHVS